uniref:Radical SAM NikJ-like protein n=1 Tax=Prochloron didemni P3-Solomon TaxID=910458 RepID=G0XS75_PRODI|nr:radical SAM NikJ-like protein [Prochloron didemni P3-Solomon]
MTASYLRSVTSINNVRCIDAGALNLTWRELSKMLVNEKFDLIAIANEFGTVLAFKRFIEYARRLSPESKLITFGRLSYQIPKFFERYNLDAIVQSGDFEAGVATYVEWLNGKRKDTPGVSVNLKGKWTQPELGIFLEAEDWAFPDIKDIPYEAYDKLYFDDTKKFCGIPERRELVILIARGCPINCHFCEIPQQQGLRERRRPISAVIDYIETCFKQAPFEYVSMYAPTFTLDRLWVEDFCQRLIERGNCFPWKCVTTIFHLDRELISLMARSGCVRISIGLETLASNSQKTLPRIKHTKDTKFDELATWCAKAGIELNCFIILGLPGQTLDNAKYTIEKVRSKGARCRPTIYTPYEKLSSDMDEETVMAYDRQFFLQKLSPLEEAEFYKLAFGEELNPTRVMSKIPSKLPLQQV